MGTHRPIYIEHRDSTRVSPKWYWRCDTCGETNAASPGTHQEAEDAALTHAGKIERVRANLHRGRGSLLIERDHAKRMMDDPNIPASDRAMWEMLYHGAMRRLGEKGAVTEEGSLW